MTDEGDFKGPRLSNLIPVSAIQRTILEISKEIEKTRLVVLNKVGNRSPKDIWEEDQAVFFKIATLLRAHLDNVIRLIRLSLRRERDIEREIGKKLIRPEIELLIKIAKDERRLMKEALAYFNYWVATDARGYPLEGQKYIFVLRNIEYKFYTAKIKDILDQFLYDDETLKHDSDSFLHSLVRKT